MSRREAEKNRPVRSAKAAGGSWPQLGAGDSNGRRGERRGEHTLQQEGADDEPGCLMAIASCFSRDSRGWRIGLWKRQRSEAVLVWSSKKKKSVPLLAWEGKRAFFSLLWPVTEGILWFCGSERIITISATATSSKKRNPAALTASCPAASCLPLFSSASLFSCSQSFLQARPVRATPPSLAAC